MAYRIVLEEDFEQLKVGVEYQVTSTKLKYLISKKVKFRKRLVAGTSVREYKFEKPAKEKENDEKE